MSRAVQSDEEEEKAEGAGEEDKDVRPKRKRSSLRASMLDDSDEDNDDEDDYTPGARKSKSKKKGKKKKKGKSRSDDDDEDEDEEEEEDKGREDDGEEAGDVSDASSEESVFQSIYDEELYKGEEDRKYLATLTEFEREAEFSRRYEEKEAAEEKWKIMHEDRMEKKRKKKGARKQEGRGRVNKAKEKTERAIDQLKERRKQSLMKKKTVSEEPEEPAEDASDAEKEEQSAEALADEKALHLLRDEEAEEEDMGRPVNFQALLTIRLSRFRLEQWCCERFFKDLVRGCFVRVGIGPNSSGVPVYRLAEIRDIKEGAPYALGGARTLFRLLLRHGDQLRSFRMDLVSNQPFTQSEYQKWLKDTKDHGVALPKMDFARQKAAEIADVKNYTHTPEDVKYTVELKKRLGVAKVNPVRAKEEVRIRLEEVQRGEGAADASELEERYRKFEDAVSANTVSSRRGISLVNERNRRMDLVKKDVSVAAIGEADVFTRRRTTPSLGFSSSRKAEEAAKKDEKVEPPKPEQPKLLPPKRHESVDDFHEAHNIQLDIDLLPPPPPPADFPSFAPALFPLASMPSSSSFAAAAAAAAGPLPPAPARVFSLEEYKRQRGLL